MTDGVSHGDVWPAFEAMNGELELAPGQEYGELRALFAMYPTAFQMIAPADSGISSIEDFEDKRLGAGPRAGTGGQYWTRGLNAMEINANLQSCMAGQKSKVLRQTAEPLFRITLIDMMP